MHVLTTANDLRIYMSTNIKFLLKPRKLESTKLNHFTVCINDTRQTIGRVLLSLTLLRHKITMYCCTSKATT